MCDVIVNLQDWKIVSDYNGHGRCIKCADMITSSIIQNEKGDLALCCETHKKFVKQAPNDNNIIHGTKGICNNS